MSRMLMEEKAIWMLISMLIIYDPIIKFLLIKDMIAASLFQDVQNPSNSKDSAQFFLKALCD